MALPPPFNILSLCSGLGGIELGIQLVLPSARTVCHVEREIYPAAVLAAHMEAGLLEPAPIYSDLTTFPAGDWRGVVDLVAAGFPCFAAGTMVLTSRGYRPIEDVRVGDLVLTHRGNWRPVTCTMARSGASVRRIQAGGTPGIITTDEHPFFSRERGSRWDNSLRRNVRTFGEPDWCEASRLGDSHYLGQVLPPVTNGTGTTDFWWLVGRYLADGWRVSRKPRGRGERKVRPTRGRVVICCAHHEALELQRRITTAGLRATPSWERTVCKFHICNGWFWEFLAPFGTLAHGKTLPGNVFSLDKERAGALLDGLLSGDGYTEPTGERRLTTVSESLALGVALLAQRAYGVVAGVRRCRMVPRTRIEGREVNQRDQFFVSIPARNRSAFVDGDYGWKLVRKNEPAGTATVYNLSVHEDESYIVSGCIVHNCQPVSVAGKQLGNEDERWMWPHVLRVVRDVEPAFVFLENVRGLFTSGFGEVLHGLADAGFDAEWGVFSAEGVGAPHRRERVFVLGYRRGLAHPLGAGLAGWEVEHDGPQRPPPERGGGDDVALAGGSGRGAGLPHLRAGEPDPLGCCALPLWPPGPLDDWRGIPPLFWPVAYPHEHGLRGLRGLREPEPGELQRTPGDESDGCDGALHPEAGRETESCLRGAPDGIPSVLGPTRPHELRGYGNGVVPICAAYAFCCLLGRALSRLAGEDAGPPWTPPELTLQRGYGRVDP